MSRSVHKTIRQIARNNTREDLDDPSNPDLLDYAKKRRYKEGERRKRQELKIEDNPEQHNDFL